MPHAFYVYPRIYTVVCWMLVQASGWSLRAALWLEDALGRRGVLQQLVCWPAGAGYEFAAAAGASPAQDPLGAGTTKRAFERAEHSIG
jgi:hypothetical protein